MPVDTSQAPPPCPYDVIGGDIIISSPVPPSPIHDPASAKLVTTAAAERHLQKYERRKFMREPELDTRTGLPVHGDIILGEILQANAIMMPWAIDPHGAFGPILKNFLLHHEPHVHQVFATNRPNATLLYTAATNHPCPSGILRTASAVWSRTSTRKFFGHSYTAPTPVEHTLQQLGLGITKAFALHHKLAMRKQGPRPANSTPVPPGFNSADSSASVARSVVTQINSPPVVIV